MATPKRSTSKASGGKAIGAKVGASKANKTVTKKAEKPVESAVYSENKDAIDRAVELCVGHLVQLERDSLAIEVINRLKEAYIRRLVKNAKSHKGGPFG